MTGIQIALPGTIDNTIVSVIQNAACAIDKGRALEATSVPFNGSNATNATNKDYILGGYPTSFELGVDSLLHGEPRMYGGSIKIRFGERSAS